MNAVLIIIAFAAIAAYEVPKLLSERLYRELVVFSCILGLGFAISFLHAVGVAIPNPIDGMGALVDRIGQLLGELF
jgi:hypothetical protein